MQRSSRLFFALWPDGATRDRIDTLARRFHADCGGRRMTRESLHVTLVFLGATLDSRIASLLDIGESIATPSFDLELTRAGSWRGGIFWLAPAAAPAPLTALVEALQQKLKAAGFSFDAKPFMPHMTVLRKARSQPAEIMIAPVEFAVRELVLLRSLSVESGVRYDVVSRFTLGK